MAFGDSEDGGGAEPEAVPMPAVPVTQAPPPTPQAPSENDLMVQDDEESLALAKQREELPDGFGPWVSLAHYLLPLYPAGLMGFFSGCCIFFWKSPKGSCMSEMSPPRFWIADIIS